MAEVDPCLADRFDRRGNRIARSATAATMRRNEPAIDEADSGQ
jgi:hypothetical protein